MSAAKKYLKFKEFFPFYLSQHQNKTCRVLHYIGSTLALSFIIYGIVSSQYKYIALAFVCGYAFAWIGHFVFEKNRPATFIYPWYSFIGDWVMLIKALKERKL